MSESTDPARQLTFRWRIDRLAVEPARPFSGFTAKSLGLTRRATAGSVPRRRVRRAPSAGESRFV